MNTEELIIDETNFNEYFFDVRTHSPQKGQTLACYQAIAEFVDGNLKRDIINLLINTDKVEAAQRILQKIGNTSEKDSIRIVREMCDDLLSGMTEDEVAEKPYEMVMEAYYYTDPDLVPSNDPHWWSTSLMQFNLENNTESTI